MGHPGSVSNGVWWRGPLVGVAVLGLTGCGPSSLDLATAHKVLESGTATCRSTETMNIEDDLVGRPSERARMVKVMRATPRRDRIYAETCGDGDFIIVGHAGETDP